MSAFHWLCRARKLVGGMLPMLLAMPFSEASAVSTPKPAVHATQEEGVTPRHPPLRPQDRLGDVLNHTAFRGFSQRILPWDGRVYDQSMPLGEIGQLLDPLICRTHQRAL